MSIQSESRELFRLNLLQQLAAIGPMGMKIPALKVGAVAGGFDTVTPTDIEAELLYLQDKHLVTETEKLISPENARWRITAEGRDFLAKQGLG